MKHLLENTKILAVIVALFSVSMIVLDRIDLPFFVVITGAAIFFCLVVFATIYRPFFGLALFVGSLPFETVDVVADVGGISLHPYQLIGAGLCVALAWSYVQRKLWTRSGHFVITDALVIGLVVLSFFVMQWTPDFSLTLRYAYIVLSFAVLYGAVRFFVTDEHHAIRTLPIIIISGCVTGMYAIAQNIAFLHGGDHHEFMPGRPNAFFAEPDWLGGYLVFVFAMCVTYLYYNAHHRHIWRFFDISLWSATVLVVVALILTVARSAWVGAAGVSALYLLLIFSMRKYKLFARHALWLGSVVSISIIIVLYAPITNFELSNRAQSTATGLQEITVSCNQEGAAAQLVARKNITNITELSDYNCRHINLEDIAHEQAIGHVVVKVMRDDPNVAVRAMTYERTIDLIRDRPFTGYGWGSSGLLLGADEHGTPLNASNIFLETALSVGVIGAGILIALCGWVVVRAGIVLRSAHEEKYRALAMFGMLGITAIVVPNLFNAGLFMGFVWFFLGAVAILNKKG